MIRDIVTDPEQLAIVSAQVEKNTPQDELDAVIADLVDTAEHYRTKGQVGCVGLAANQLGIHWRIVTIWYNNAWLTMINPAWSYQDDKKGYAHEGCLSRPGVRAKVKRYKRIHCNWMAQDRFWHQGKFNHFYARVIQHEVDHLDGIFINN